MSASPAGSARALPPVTLVLGGARSGKSSFAEQVCRNHRRGCVYLAPGEYFDAPGHVRIGFGQPVEKLREALVRLTAALQAHRRGSG